MQRPILIKGEHEATAVSCAVGCVGILLATPVINKLFQICNGLRIDWLVD